MKLKTKTSTPTGSKPTTFYSVYEWSGGDQGMTALMEGWGMVAVDDPMDADIVVFNGGADIGTEIYGERPAMAGIPGVKSARDRVEVELYAKVIKAGKFVLGICRGSQLLNCLNGGTLWQHVDKHGREHRMIDVRTGKMYHVTSTHHQQMRPNLKAGQLIGVAYESTIKYAEGICEVFDRPKDTEADTEIVWYPKSRTLCVQGHPEYVPNSDFARYVQQLVGDLMNSKKDAA